MPKDLDFHVTRNDDGFFVATSAQYPGIQGVSTGLLASVDDLIAKIVGEKLAGRA